jgi:protein TonB
MFEQSFLEVSPSGKRSASVLVSVVAQLFLLFVLIAIPVFYTHGLPEHFLKAFVLAPSPPRAASSPESQTAAKSVKSQSRLLNIQNLVSRPILPLQLHVAVLSGPAPELGVPGGSYSADDNGLPGVIGSTSISSPPPAPEPAKPISSKPLRIGGHAEEANLIYKVMPIYPPLAKSARVEGSVEFTAFISKEGMIENLQLVRGHPLLVKAAKEAVLQWRYRPTLLNGVSVEVVTDITVNFRLAQ